jgi:hypothetical protein
MTFIPTWVRTRVEIDYLFKADWFAVSHTAERLPEKPEGRFRVSLEDTIELAWALEAQAYLEWSTLVETREFIIDVNIEWLDYEVFRQQMGLPTQEDQTLVKNDQYVNYAHYSVAWV